MWSGSNENENKLLHEPQTTGPFKASIGNDIILGWSCYALAKLK